MWQSNRSRSTGWHSPAVPPVRSASQPGENTSEQPIGKCGAGCGCVRACRCSATTSPSELRSRCLAFRSTRSALLLTALRCFMCLDVVSVHACHADRSAAILVVELREKRRIPFRQLAVDLQADVGPAADPVAVVQVRPRRLAVARVRLVIAAARTERPRPARAAVGLVRDVMRLEERLLRVAIDAVADGPELVRVGPGEAVAQRDVAVGRDAEQAEAGAARDTPCSRPCGAPRASPSRSRSRDGGSRPTPRGIRRRDRGTAPSISS